jgi:plasmid maintenance system antidote protein VapI
VSVRGGRDTAHVARRDVTNRPFPEELPRVLAERKESLRALARAIGGIDHAYLSRMVSGQASVNPRHAERIAVHLGLPSDYFPEVREAAVIAAVQARPRLRDKVYFEHVRTRRS